MKNMNFDRDYTPDFYSGGYLNEILEAERIGELILTIISLADETFSDTKNPQWVANFGAGLPRLRIKPAIGRSLRQGFGPNSADWIGKRIALCAEPIEWEDSATGEKKSGFTIKARPVGDNEATSLRSPPPNDSLDDDIGF